MPDAAVRPADLRRLYRFQHDKKAAKDDTSAAKLIKEINSKGTSLDDTGISDLRSLSDVVLFRLAGFTLEKLIQSEI